MKPYQIWKHAHDWMESDQENGEYVKFEDVKDLLDNIEDLESFLQGFFADDISGYAPHEIVDLAYEQLEHIMEDMGEMQESSRWYSSGEQLPNYNEKVLVIVPSAFPKVYMGYLHYTDWRGHHWNVYMEDGIQEEKIRLWRPMPGNHFERYAAWGIILS